MARTIEKKNVFWVANQMGAEKVRELKPIIAEIIRKRKEAAAAREKTPSSKKK
jgi:hypothetical protein